MDARNDERARAALHAVVNPRIARRHERASSPLVAIVKPALMTLVAISLLAAVAGGLLRAGAAWSVLRDSETVGQAAVAHAALMLSGFLGTVIAIERAVAVKLRWAFVATFASGAASVFLLAGQGAVAAWLGVFAAAVFVAVNVVVVRRQSAPHTALLLVGAAAWFIGNLLFALGLGITATMPWWFAFLVLTIAAERLEMTRLMRRHPAAHGSLYAVVLALLLGAAGSGIVFGAALTALAAWLVTFDIARRTVFAHGLSRYMAVCLLGGYAWLVVAGVAWLGMALGCPGRDFALHALGLGFIVSMVMGHAPVILPAVTRIKLQFGPWFYVPLGSLHASLILRLVGGIGDPHLRTTGAVLNVAALALFAATVVGSAIAWRVRDQA